MDAYIQNHKLDEKGGSDWRVLDTREMPSHNHTGTTSENGENSHNLNRNVYKHQRSFKGDDAHDHTLKHCCGQNWVNGTDKAGKHSHTFTTSTNGSDWAHGNVPPYYVLTYIMKL